jgi:uncharacterized protein with GYD domain
MTTFFMFGKYSGESVKKISSKRTKEATELIQKNGGEVKAGYALLGKYDLVLIVDLPNKEQAMKTSVGLTRMLGISFSTAPAVTVEEFDQLMKDV